MDVVESSNEELHISDKPYATSSQTNKIESSYSLESMQYSTDSTYVK